MTGINIELRDLVGLVGAITGPMALLISYLNYRRDRGHLKVEVLRERMIINDAKHDPNELVANIHIVNEGRRTVRLMSTGYSHLRKRGGAILADSMRGGPVELSEGHGVDYFLNEEDLKKNIDDIAYFVAYDSIGRKFKKYNKPRSLVFLYWLLDKTHLRIKPRARSKTYSLIV